MGKIKQLSRHEAQKIAAGEVVERPANIVKELVENSIDAEATRITIYIENAGKKLIRIVDNGCGMDFADAQMCFDRHATSKITQVEELASVKTFGFRGEALASIASISQIILITKEESSLEGTKIIIHSNTITDVSSVACATGTDISIHHIFDNVPARKKFLKTEQTEWRAIQLLFNAFCFSYPHIHFFLFADGKQVLNCPATPDLKTRALQLWEPSIHTHLLVLQAAEKDFSLSGIISDHQHHRYDRSGIYFFVNNRWVKNQHLSSAFIKGYANVLATGKYPAAALHITVPTHEVDINIHPRKEEVKFLHPRRIEQALQETVKMALEKNLSHHLKKDVEIRPSFSPQSPFHSNWGPHLPQASFYSARGPHQEELKMGQASGTENSSLSNSLPLDPSPFVVSLFNPHLQLLSTGTPIETEWKLGQNHTNTQNPTTVHQLNLTNEHLPQNNNITAPESSPYRLIGQYNATYLLTEKEDGLFLVDQHAAHERILYELFSERFTEVATIQLLFPQIIILSTQDMTVITPHLDIFINNGIIIEQCASDQLIVQSLPVHLKDQSLYDIIRETISWITDPTSLYELARADNTDENIQALKKTLNNKLQAQMACKAAVKAGDILTSEQMTQLLRDLDKTANRFSCPHGRPTGWLLSLHDIKKKFKRRM